MVVAKIIWETARLVHQKREAFPVAMSSHRKKAPVADAIQSAARLAQVPPPEAIPWATAVNHQAVPMDSAEETALAAADSAVAIMEAAVSAEAVMEAVLMVVVSAEAIAEVVLMVVAEVTDKKAYFCGFRRFSKSLFIVRNFSCLCNRS